jgi:hypothetical protein
VATDFTGVLYAIVMTQTCLKFAVQKMACGHGRLSRVNITTLLMGIMAVYGAEMGALHSN